MQIEAPHHGSHPLHPDKPLKIVIDPGDAPPEFIADILSDISRLYRKAGGSGITFVFDEVLAAEQELA